MPVLTVSPLSRRDLLQKTGALSAAGIALLASAGIPRAALAADAAASGNKDVDTLNIALGIEHQAIGAYQIGVDGGLLKQSALNLAFLFQSHHKTYRDALVAAIQKIGGTPAVAQNTGDYAKELNAQLLKTQNDFLDLALKLELGALNAYIGIVPDFQDHELAKLASRIIADISMHWTAIASTLGHPLPENGLTFGA